MIVLRSSLPPRVARTIGRRWLGSTNQTMHFLTPAYRADDPRMHEANTVEFHLSKGQLLVNGWPAGADAVKALLPSLDSFERALGTEADSSEFRNGVELIYKQLYDALLKMGLRPIPAKGEPFDPRFHQAVEMVNTTDAKDHQVLEELQRGYKFKDRLLRPAMVKVAQNPKH